MNAFSFTPSSLLSKNDACLSNPSLSYQWWFYFCLFLLEQFIRRVVFCFASFICLEDLIAETHRKAIFVEDLKIRKGYWFSQSSASG